MTAPFSSDTSYVDPWSNVPKELVYDDDALEAVLYGRGAATPTLACIHVGEPNPLLIAVLIDSGDRAALERTYHDLVAYVESRPRLERATFIALVAATRKLLPVWPRSLKQRLPASATVFLEALWRRSRTEHEEELADGTGALLWEWYEYLQRAEDAREVLGVLVETARSSKRPEQASLLLSQLAYQWMSEKKWAEAEKTYDEAGKLALGIKSRRNYLIARIGWWFARFEMGGAGVAEALRDELSSFLPELEKLGTPMTLRKALVVLARAEALLEAWDQAVRHIDRALDIDRGQEAMFLPEDLALQAMLHRQVSPDARSRRSV